MKCQMGTWSPELLLKATWIESVIELDTGSPPDDTTVYRMAQDLPPLVDCIAQSQCGVDSVLNGNYSGLFGVIQNPVAINHYRQFLKRMDINGLKESDELRISAFISRATECPTINIRLLEEISPYAPRLRDPCWNTIEEHCYFSGGANVDIPRKYACMLTKAASAESAASTNIPSRIHVVPKDWKGGRIITVGSAFNSYYQHGIDTVFRSAIMRSVPITFHSQRRNRIRCNPWYDTTDLSNASDSVRWTHVEYLIPNWYNVLRSYRTRTIAYADNVYNPTFVGGMGDPITFSVETAIISFIGIAGARYLYKMGDISRETLSRIEIDSAWYGDDAVVASGFGQKLIWLLTELGFDPNMTKSFYAGCGHDYRETCGVEWLPGFSEKVGPYSVVRLPRGASSDWAYTSDLESLISFTNQLTICGALESAHRFISRLSRVRPELHCVGRVPYWANDYSELSLARQQECFKCFIPSALVPEDPLTLIDIFADRISGHLKTTTVTSGVHHFDGPLLRSCIRQNPGRPRITLAEFSPSQWYRFGQRYALWRVRGFYPDVDPREALQVLPTIMKVRCNYAKRCRNSSCRYSIKNSSGTGRGSLRKG
jgi:hypothetical protein